MVVFTVVKGVVKFGVVEVLEASVEAVVLTVVVVSASLQQVTNMPS